MDRTFRAYAVTNLQPSDFYRPIHGEMFAVVAAAHAQGWTPDAHLVHQELVRMGHETVPFTDVLDAVAGAPALASATQYVEVVRRTSILRRMLTAAREISQLAYSNPVDPFAALDTARMQIDDVVDPGETDQAVWLPDLGDLLDSGLEQEQPQLMERTDGARLLYSGRMHTIQGLPSAGKSWAALHACAEVLEVGGGVVYVDYEDSPAGITSRLVGLGTDPATVRSGQFRYAKPEAGFGMQTQAIFRRLCEELVPDLVVIDGVAEAMALDGLDENSNSDFLVWTERCPRWLVRNFGPAVLMLDHTSKSKDAQQEGRHARGAGAKLGAIDGAVYTAKAVRPFSRERAGSTKLVIAKDRPGGVGAVGEVAAFMTVDPKARGEKVEIRMEADASAISSDDTWKPTVLMRMVSDELEQSAEPLTRRSLEALVKSDKPKLVREAITRLVTEGWAQERQRGRQRVIHLVKPYRDGANRPTKDEQSQLDVFGEPDNVVTGPWADRSEPDGPDDDSSERDGDVAPDNGDDDRGDF